MQINVYEFTDPREFLVGILKEKQTANPRFSLRAWSKQLGFSSPNMLSMILRGERSLRPKVVTSIAESLNLKETEKRYFEILTVFSRAKTPNEKNIYANILKEIRPDKKFSTLALDEFKCISDWYHIAIIEMVRLKDFKSDPLWISKRLGSTVSTQIVKDSIERLIRLEILKRDKNGKLICQKKDYSTTYDVSNEAIQKFHSQMIEKAQEALKNQPVDKREVSSITFTIDSSKIKKAKEVIRRFQDELSKAISTDNGDQTYQLNVQFFNLTDGGQK